MRYENLILILAKESFTKTGKDLSHTEMEPGMLLPKIVESPKDVSERHP